MMLTNQKKSQTDRLNKSAIYYGSISLFTTILHNVFILYHIEMFVSVFKIDKASFWIGETIFLIWNSLNDPLFGWIGDRSQVSSNIESFDSSQNVQQPGDHNIIINENASNRQVSLHHRHTTVSVDEESKTSSHPRDGIRPYQTGASSQLIVKRTKMISACGPLLALSFLLLWFDWMMPAIQFALCLCIYDAFLTMVDLHHSALLADLSLTADARTSMNTYESIFSAIGSSSVFMSYLFWDKHDLTKFRIFCVVLAVISASGFYVVSTALRSIYVINEGQYAKRDLSQLKTQNALSQGKSMRKFIRELLKQKNFLMFTIINVIQVFHCHFNSNFFPLFMEALVDDHQHYGAFLIGVSFVLPHLNNILFLQLCKTRGVYFVIKLLFYIKLLLAVTMWMTGHSHGWMLCLFIASNRVFTEGTCKLLSLVISDLIDEDYVRNNREEPISALMFGMANFLAKPGQTLAPIIGTSLISIMTGTDLFKHSSPSISGGDAHPTDPIQTEAYRQACFSILVYVPIICASLQIIAWSFYKLHGTKLKHISILRGNIPSMLTV